MAMTMPNINDILAQKIQDIQSRLPVAMNVPQAQADSSFAAALADASGTAAAAAGTAAVGSGTQTASELQLAMQTMMADSFLGNTADSATNLSGTLSGLLGSTAANSLTGGTASANSLAGSWTGSLSGSSVADSIGTGWPRLNATQIETIMPRIDTAITASAKTNGLDPKLLRALIKQESSFQPFCLSSAGAMGLTQLMPDTAGGLGVTEPYDIESNIEGGARYLAQQLDTFGGDLSLALAAYNAGPNAVRSHGGVPPFAETKDFVNKVVGYYNSYRAAAL